MKTKNKIRISLILISLIASVNAFGDIPYVYSLENSGANIVRSATVMPALANCPTIVPLPDPFAWSADPLGVNPPRSEAFADWETHRQEIMDMLQFYEIGTKPVVDKATQVTATYSGTTLTVITTVGGKTLTQTASVTVPSGTGPFPAIIGMNSSNGSLNASDFSTCIKINFAHDQVTTYNGFANTDKFFTLYPTQNVDNTGQYAIWAWGVSRLLDGLEKVQGTGTGKLNIDMAHISVAGCSYSGKMAIWCAAFDERIAVSFGQESGGGGATSWRYSANITAGGTSVEGLAQTDKNWFKNDMFKFGGIPTVYKIPTDHHMLMALVAPRMLWESGNTNYTWLSNISNFVCAEATKKIYTTLGVPDRFVYVVDGNHEHCAFPTNQQAQITYMINKGLKGQTTLTAPDNQHPAAYDTTKVSRWSAWWGSGVPDWGKVIVSGKEYHYLEAESYVSATNGTNFDVLNADTFALKASNHAYVVAKPNLAFVSSMSRDSVANWLTIPFTVDQDSTYYIYARVSGVDTSTDSFFVRVDDGGASTFKVYNNWYTGGSWAWKPFSSAIILKKGTHKVTFAIRHAESRLDKILITNHTTTPNFISGVNSIHANDGYSIANWSNPINNKITIGFEIPTNSTVSFQVHNMLGEKVVDLAGKDYQSGKNSVELNATNFPKGVYICTMKANKVTVSRKMTL